MKKKIKLEKRGEERLPGICADFDVAHVDAKLRRKGDQ